MCELVDVNDEPESGDASGASSASPGADMWDTITDSPEEALSRRLLEGLGYCGHYMHFHGGGRSGKAPIICLIAKRGGQITQQELGSFFELKPGSLSEVLAKIETAGFIERTRNPEDRRQLTIRLTDKGRAEAARDQEARRHFRAQAFDCLSIEERKTLLDMLERIRTRWEELDD
ncbi:MAG TPA: MarR family transcriptional regulator [Candidatus Limicola stercorigallinarum]|nr:MarR family transcriptional regulator [Candidatus Limicola stercorigallinarum]